MLLVLRLFQAAAKGITEADWIDYYLEGVATSGLLILRLFQAAKGIKEPDWIDCYLEGAATPRLD